MDIKRGIIASRTNLIETKRETPFPWKGISLIFLIIFAAWGIIYYLNYQTKKDIAQLQSNLNSLKKTRDYQKIAFVSDAEKRTNSIREILETKSDWINFFKKVESLTIPDVTLDTLNVEKVNLNPNNIGTLSGGGDTSFKVEIKGSTVGVNNLSKQISAFKDGGENSITDDIIVRKIDIKKMEGESDRQGAIDFNLEFDANPNILKGNYLADSK